jgi:hypothetical protein
MDTKLVLTPTQLFPALLIPTPANIYGEDFIKDLERLRTNYNNGDVLSAHEPLRPITPAKVHSVTV